MKQIICKFLFSFLIVFAPFFTSATIVAGHRNLGPGNVTWIANNFATWNGASWTHSLTYVPTSNDTVYILSGYTMALSNVADSCYNLIVESGAKLYSNQSSGTEYNLYVYGTMISDSGMIGNPGTTDGIDFNIEGTSCTISGPGTFEAYRIRKSFSGAPSKTTTSLTINMNVKLTCNKTGAPCGSIYNGTAAATVFNVTFGSTTVDSIWSYGATPVGNLSINGQAGNSTTTYGTFTVNGTLVIADTLYLTSSNTSAGKTCTLAINGTIVTSYINASYSAAGGYTVSMAANSLLNIVGTPFTTPFYPNYRGQFSTSHNTFSQAAGSTIEYGGSGVQTIDTGLNYQNLTLGGSGTKTAPGDTLLIYYNLSINSSVTFVHASDIFVGGNWTDYGTFTNTGSTVTFNGIIPTKITAPGGENFANVAVKKTFTPQYITLDSTTGSTLIINGALTLTSGIIISDTSNSGTNYVSFASGAGVSGANNNSFVYGRVSRTGTSAFTFPVGKSNEYRPISVGASSSSVTWFAQYFKTDPNAASVLMSYPTNQVNAPIDSVSRCEYWTLEPTSDVTDSVTLSWDTYSCGVGDPSLLLVTMDISSSTSWTSYGNGGTTGNNSKGTIVSSSFSLISFTGGQTYAFTLGTTDLINPLPVSLLSFTAKANQGDVLVSWKTASEINNDYFTIEKTADGNSFTIAGTVNGNGNSTSEINYSFTDRSPFQGVSYYRLKQTDYDGKYSCTRPVSVSFPSKGKPSIILFPNPVSDHAFISFGGETTSNEDIKGKTYTVNIFDLSGREAMPSQIISLSSGVSQSVDVSMLINGIYMLELNADGDIQRVNLVKE